MLTNWSCSPRTPAVHGFKMVVHFRIAVPSHVVWSQFFSSEEKERAR